MHPHADPTAEPSPAGSHVDHPLAERDPWWLRRDGGPATKAADAVRGLVVVLLAWAVFSGAWPTAALWALVALGVALLRARDVPPALDLAGSLTLTAAAWSGVAGLYERFAALDLVIHLASGVVLAALAVRLFGLTTRHPGLALLRHTLAALALAYVWELLEWGGHVFVDPSIYVTYTDTMSDILATTLGGTVAGLWAARTRTAPATANAPAPAAPRRTTPGDAP